MCSNWIIDGLWCDSGASLVGAIGLVNARFVNTYYDEVGKPGHWMQGKNGERIDIAITEETVAGSCLCWVDRERMKEVTGRTYEFDCDKDAFVALEDPSDA